MVCSIEACSAKEDFNCSVAVESIVCSVVGCSDYSLAVCSTTVCYGSSPTIFFIACSVVGCSGCLALEMVGIIVAWIGGEEILLKMFA